MNDALANPTHPTPPPQPSMNRRTALTAIGLSGLGASLLAPTAQGADADAAFPPDIFGWDKATGQYTLPPLPYAYDALEPQIDAETMHIHHDKHHAGYVKGLNKALAQLADLRSGDHNAEYIKAISRDLAFNGAGHVNHSIFWQIMAPAGKGGGGTPSGALARAIDRDFGSFDNFAWQFKAASGAVEGSGWGWLVHEPIADKLMVLQFEKHQNQYLTGATPLLGIDVWEHAYYLKYQNKRGDYVTAFMDIVNWPFVAKLYDHATA